MDRNLDSCTADRFFTISHQGSPWPQPNVTLRNHVMSLSTISWWGGRGRICLPSPSPSWLKICPMGDWLCAFLGCIWNHLGTKLGPWEWWSWEGQGSGREYGLAIFVCFRSLSPGRIRIKDRQGQRGLNGSPLQPLRSALAILPFPERGGLSPTGQNCFKVIQPVPHLPPFYHPLPWPKLQLVWLFPGGVIQTFIPKGSEPLTVLPWEGCECHNCNLLSSVSVETPRDTQGDSKQTLYLIWYMQSWLLIHAMMHGFSHVSLWPGSSVYRIL